jgi:Ca-activated chloride channel family protein
MTVSGTFLIALLVLQSNADVPPISTQEAQQPSPQIEFPEEMTGRQVEPIAESTWQDTEIETLMQKARESLLEDRYPEALDLYIAASDRRPLDERLQYNLGVAAYRAGNMETATRAFERASSGTDPKITQSALFNRGNVSYKQALDSVKNAQNAQSRERATEGQANPQTLDDPISALKQALAHYRDAIIASPDTRDARRNAELAHRLMKALEEKQEEQEQKQEQEQQEQNQQEQDQQEQDQQEQDQQEQDQQEQGQQNQDQQNQDQQEQDQQEQDQQEQDQQEQDQQEQDQQEQDQQEQDQQEQDQQEQDQQEQDQQEQQEQEDQKEEDAKSSKEPKAETTEDSTNKDGKPVRMTREQAEALLQMIRDKEKERREVLATREAREAARKKIPVEKDW